MPRREASCLLDSHTKFAADGSMVPYIWNTSEKSDPGQDKPHTSWQCNMCELSVLSLSIGKVSCSYHRPYIGPVLGSLKYPPVFHPLWTAVRHLLPVLLNDHFVKILGRCPDLWAKSSALQRKDGRVCTQAILCHVGRL